MDTVVGNIYIWTMQSAKEALLHCWFVLPHCLSNTEGQRPWWWRSSSLLVPIWAISQWAPSSCLGSSVPNSLLVCLTVGSSTGLCNPPAIQGSAKSTLCVWTSGIYSLASGFKNTDAAAFVPSLIIPSTHLLPTFCFHLPPPLHSSSLPPRLWHPPTVYNISYSIWSWHLPPGNFPSTGKLSLFHSNSSGSWTLWGPGIWDMMCCYLGPLSFKKAVFSEWLPRLLLTPRTARSGNPLGASGPSVSGCDVSSAELL